MYWVHPTYSCTPQQLAGPGTVGSNKASAYRAHKIFGPNSLGWAYPYLQAYSFLRAFYFPRAFLQHPFSEAPAQVVEGQGLGEAQYSQFQHVFLLSLFALLCHMGLHPLILSMFPSLHQLQFYLSLQFNEKNLNICFYSKSL